MSRKLTAIFVAGAMALGSISTNAWSAPGPTQQIESSGVQNVLSETKNVPPLSPAGAAGIREAQGAGYEPWILGGFIALFVLVILLDSGGDDDDDVPSAPGTQ